MSIACPYCKTVVIPNGFKPGRHTPKCPRCGNPFVLIVPERGGGTVTVRRLVIPNSAVDPTAPTDRLPVASSLPPAKAPLPGADTEKLRKPGEEPPP
jgi:hypothetical protein